MFAPVVKLVCVAAAVFASAGIVRAQQLSIVYPAPNITLQSGSATVVGLKISGSPILIDEIALVIGSLALWGEDTTDLGYLHYTGVFTPQWIDDAGNAYQNISILAPNYFNDLGLLTVARFHLDGGYATPELDRLTLPINIIGSTG